MHYIPCIASFQSASYSPPIQGHHQFECECNATWDRMFARAPITNGAVTDCDTRTLLRQDVREFRLCDFERTKRRSYLDVIHVNILQRLC